MVLVRIDATQPWFAQDGLTLSIMPSLTTFNMAVDFHQCLHCDKTKDLTHKLLIV